jgi:predicted MFS family arabinose efflux permease
MQLSPTPKGQDTKIDSQRDYRLTWTATFLFFIAYYALIVPLPRYLSAIGLADWQVGFVLGASAIASLMIRPISGLLTDRLGYKPMLFLGALALMVGASTVALTTSMTLLFCLRILQTLGYVAFTTAGNALVGRLASAEERSTKIAYFGLAANFAMTATPGVTDLLLPTLGLTPFFWIAGCIALAAGVMTWFLRFVPSNNAPTNHNGAVSSAQWHIPKQVWLAMLVAALFGAGFGAYFQYFAILLERREIAAAPVYATYGLSIIATRLLLGRYLDRIGLGRVLAIAAGLMAIGLVVAAFGTSILWLVVAAALIAIGGGFFHPMLIAHHVNLLPDRPGWAVACFYFGFDAGIGIGAWILGAILDLSGLTALYLAASFLTLLTLLFVPAMLRQATVNQTSAQGA